MRKLARVLGALAFSASFARSIAAQADSAQIERGKYLVELGRCTHCHTPGYMFGKPDTSRYLGGSDLGFDVAGLGIFVGPNLTRDKETGLGIWTKVQIAGAIRTGVRPDGRVLAPVMPWRDLAALTDSDVDAIVDYLRSLPPVSHQVPGPFGSQEKPEIFRMTVVPPNGTSQLERTQ